MNVPTDPRKIYVATSWRNVEQPNVVRGLRDAGHEVYDFRNPRDGDTGFHWSDIDPDWQRWTPEQYVAALDHPIAVNGFESDFNAMKWADTFLLLEPCGISAHLELGWAVGAGKLTILLLAHRMEPELMVKMCDHVCTNLSQVLELLDVK